MVTARCAAQLEHVSNYCHLNWKILYAAIPLGLMLHVYSDGHVNFCSIDATVHDRGKLNYVSHSPKFTRALVS